MLEMIEQPPAPPTYAELADAIVAFHTEFYALNWSDYSGTPADLILLGLAERLVASQKAPESAIAPILGVQEA